MDGPCIRIFLGAGHLRVNWRNVRAMSHKVTPWLLVLEIQTIAFHFYVLICVFGLRRGSALKHFMFLQQNRSTGQPCRVAVDPAAYPVLSVFTFLEKHHVSELKCFWQIMLYICITHHSNICRGCLDWSVLATGKRQRNNKRLKKKNYI